MKRLAGGSEPMVAVVESNGDVTVYKVTPDFEKNWLQDPDIDRETIVQQLKQRANVVPMDYVLNI